MSSGFTPAQSAFLRASARVAYTETTRAVTHDAAFADVPGAHVFHVTNMHETSAMRKLLVSTQHPHPDYVSVRCVVVLYAATIWIIHEPMTFPKVARLLANLCTCRSCRRLCVHWRRHLKIPTTLFCDRSPPFPVAPARGRSLTRSARTPYDAADDGRRRDTTGREERNRFQRDERSCYPKHPHPPAWRPKKNGRGRIDDALA